MLPLCFALLACGSGNSPGLSGDTTELAMSWVGQVTQQPDRFTETIEVNQAGWIALHANDLPAALEAGGAPAARAHAELSALHTVLSRISGLAWEKTLAKWNERSALPEGSSITWFAALAAIESGDSAGALALLTSLEEARDEPVKEAVNVLIGKLEDELSPGSSHEAWEAYRADPTQFLSNPLLNRLTDHYAVRDQGLPLPQSTDTAAPLYTETERELERHFFDPQLHGTLAIHHASSAGEEPQEGLAGLLFSSCANSESQGEAYRQVTALAGSTTPTIQVTAGCVYDPAWKALGLVALADEGDDAEAARTMARQLQAGVDAWKNDLARNANADSLALIQDLQLVDLAHSRILLSIAHHAINTDRPRQAQALALLARDMTTPGELSPRNPPSLFAILAESSLRTGHTREALDALEVLADHLPDVHGLDETVGDLAVLETLGRRGDSKEY